MYAVMESIPAELLYNDESTPAPPKKKARRTTTSPAPPSISSFTWLSKTALEERKEKREKFERSRVAALNAPPAPQATKLPSQLFLQSYPCTS